MIERWTLRSQSKLKMLNFELKERVNYDFVDVHDAIYETRYHDMKLDNILIFLNSTRGFFILYIYILRIMA